MARCDSGGLLFSSRLGVSSLFAVVWRCSLLFDVVVFFVVTHFSNHSISKFCSPTICILLLETSAPARPDLLV